MHPKFFGLALLFVVTTTAAAAVREAPFSLASAECAARLIDSSLVRRPYVDQVTPDELALVAAVPETPSAILDFLRHTFPALKPVDAAMVPRLFGALWRRLPEVHPPSARSVTTLDDDAIVTSWREFKDVLGRVSTRTETSGPRPPSDFVIEFDRRAQLRLAALSAGELNQIMAVPWDAKDIVNWLRVRYPKQSVRRSGWGDQTFNLLWRETFNVPRPSSHLLKVDTDQVIFKDSPAARDRVLREWRLFIMFLVFHQKPRDF
jgi:hypothetical protein